MKIILILVLISGFFISCGSNLSEQEKRALEKKYKSLEHEEAVLKHKLAKVKKEADRLFKEATSLEKKKKIVAKSVVVLSKFPKNQIVIGPLPFKYKKGYFKFKSVKVYKLGVLNGVKVLKASFMK